MLEQYLVYEGAFARTGDSCDATQHAQRKVNVKALYIVSRGTLDVDPACGLSSHRAGWNFLFAG
jgi:hypothetical protein